MIAKASCRARRAAEGLIGNVRGSRQDVRGKGLPSRSRAEAYLQWVQSIQQVPFALVHHLPNGDKRREPVCVRLGPLHVT